MTARKPTDSSSEVRVQSKVEEPVREEFKRQCRDRGKTMKDVIADFVRDYVNADDEEAILTRIDEINLEIEQIDNEIKAKQAERNKLAAERDSLQDRLEAEQQAEENYEEDLRELAQHVEEGMAVSEDSPGITRYADKHDVSPAQIIDDLQEIGYTSDNDDDDEPTAAEGRLR